MNGDGRPLGGEQCGPVQVGIVREVGPMPPAVVERVDRDVGPRGEDRCGAGWGALEHRVDASADARVEGAGGLGGGVSVGVEHAAV